MVFNPPKHDPPLRIKLAKIISKGTNCQCKPFMDHLKMFNQKTIDYALSKKHLNKQVKQSRKFAYENYLPWDVYYMPSERFETDFNYLSEELRANLTYKELNLISGNKDCYLKEKDMRDNLDLIKDNTLTIKLNREDNLLPLCNRKETSSGKRLKSSFNSETLLSRNRENFKYFEELVKKSITADKSERKTNEINKLQRDHFINQLYKRSQNEINSLLFKGKKSKPNISSFLITQDPNKLSSFKSFDQSIETENKPQPNMNIGKGNQLSPILSSSHIKKYKGKIKLPAITSPNKSSNKAITKEEEIWLKQYKQELKVIFKGKNQPSVPSNL